MKELSIEEQIYLCKYHDVDTALTKTMHINSEEVEKLIQKYKENGLYEQYRNLSDEEYEEVIKKEKISKKYKKTEINYEKQREILNKYNFDKSKEAYKYFLIMLSEAEKVIRNDKEFVLAEVFRRIGEKTNIMAYNIQNECQRYLTKTYIDNKELFSKYKQKPTIKEFLLSEINIQKETFETIEETPTQENNVISNTSTNNILREDMLIQVPIKMVQEYFYMKRIYRCKRKS